MRTSPLAGFRSLARSRGASLLLAGLLVVQASSCHEKAASVSPSRQKLAVGIVALVGSQEISAELVRGIRDAQRVTLERAREDAIRDALFAQAARDRLPSSLARVLDRSLAARSLLEELLTEARAKGPATD